MAKKTETKAAPKKAAKAAPQDQAASEDKAAGGKVGKAQLVEMVSEKTSLTKKQASEVVDCMLDTVVEALRGGKTVGLPGLGTLGVRTTAERQGVRPGTTERITIPAGKKVGFKVASDLRGSLQEG